MPPVHIPAYFYVSQTNNKSLTTLLPCQKKITRWLLLRKFIAPVLLLAALTVVGTVGYVFIDGYSWINALYITIITVGTVVFGER
ncbi:MAG: hypothetical protein LCH58_10045 [Bacteroidetes bacterium]|uniref:hypothetical protein n=1 Tax=Phnomibacter sp. TaxID=2836217 RepID=UPI002FDE35FA|nr:hypothetical protein [Bacteroidota bacterium]